MAYPPAYVRAYSFTDFETNNPGQPKPGDKLDAEYDSVSNALTGTQNALALIQRADGALANNSVGEDQLQDGLLDGLTDGITDDAQAAADAAAASAAAAAGSASAAAGHAGAALSSENNALGAAAQAGVSQGVAQTAASNADAAANNAAIADDNATSAANEALGFRNEAQLHEETAFKWAEYLAAPVAPAPPGWPEAVDDGMFSAKWWALRSRDYNHVTKLDFGNNGANVGEGFDIWDAGAGHDLPIGQVYATWGPAVPPHTFALTDPSQPSDPDSWTDTTGGPGPAGPANTLTIGTVVAGNPAAATITGVSPNQVLNLTLQTGATGATGPTGATGATGAAGPPNTLTVGEVETFPPGSFADVIITGTAPNQVISFQIPRGDVGPTGPAGAVGSQGPQGVQGPQGPIGIQGPVGVDGPTGPAGVAGPQGPIGATGVAGPTGAAGPTGPTGPTGSTGPAGAQGPQGIQGVAGPAGPVNFANPSALVGLAAINGSSTNAMRADGAPAINQAITPTWTGQHNFATTVNLQSQVQLVGDAGLAGQVLASQGAGQPTTWRTAGGGSIDLGYNFNTSTANANPGNQKLAFNTGVYASVSAIYFNQTAFNNFDASTILSLLQAGNRIYLQARNDASKAVVYQVTGVGTDNSGWWTVPVTIVNQRGALFLNNGDLAVVFILSASAAAVVGNPTALIGLTAVNGVAATALRSDGAPALDQAIAPTWTGLHTFTNTGQTNFGGNISGTPAVFALDVAVNTKIQSINSTLSGMVGTQSNHPLEIRTNNTIRATWGASGGQFLAGATGGNMGAGTINATGLFINGVAVSTGAGTPGGSNTQLQFNNSGAFGGDPELTWDATNNILTVGSSTSQGTITGGANTNLLIKGAQSATFGNGVTMNGGAAASGNNNGGGVFINGGAGLGTGSGGAGQIIGGSGSTTGIGGNAVLQGGDAGTPGLVVVKGGNSNGTNIAGGAAQLVAGGASGTGTGGQVLITAGVSITGAGGNILFRTAASNSLTDRLYINANGSWGLAAAGTVGTSGQVLTSQGAAPPIWANASGTPAGSNTQVQFNNAGAFGASAQFTWTDGTATLTLGSAAVGPFIQPPSNAGAGIVMSFRGGPTTGAGNKGGTINMQGGIPTDGDGGDAAMSGRIGAGTARAGGDVYISSAGPSDPGGRNGFIQLTAAGASSTALGYIQFRTGLGGANSFYINGNGSWGLGAAGTVGTSGQVLTSAGGAIPTWTTPAAAVAGANPSATIGLAAVNGSAGTFMRSDAAPALSVAITPTWSAAHTFSATLSTTNGPVNLVNATSTGILYSVSGQGADGKVWLDSCSTTFRQFSIYNDAGSAGKNYLSIQRAANVVTAVNFGNAVDNPPYTFLGTGTVSAASFTTTSARASKRETGAPNRAASILSKLRPLLYRLLGDDREQLGLIAEEVREVCPQLSDGKSVAYDRLAILLLAAWQEEHAEAA